MTNERIQPFVKTLLLVALGVFLYSRIANGTLLYYINERFAIFTVIGAVGLLLLGVSYRWERPTPTDDAEQIPHDHIHGDHSHGDHSHGDHSHGDHSHGDHSHGDHNHGDHSAHDHSHALSWSSMAIIALPIVLGLSITPQPLGSAALANRDVALSMNESALPPNLRNREKAALDKNIMDWWHEFRSSATAGQELLGQEVKVSGFVFRDLNYGEAYDEDGTEHFLVTRFVVSCCVADANVLGLLVSVPAEIAAALPQLNDDQWVEVYGTFAANSVDGWHMPIVVAQQITPIAVPNQPYLYP